LKPPRFLHIGLTYQPTRELVEGLDRAVETEAFDWMRYSFHCYLVWSSSDAETICRKILRVPGMGFANVFICAIDITDGFGYLPPWAWEWIRRDRGSGPLNTWVPMDQPGLPAAWPELPSPPPELPMPKFPR
jgi:hypothetical protein